MKWLAVSPTDPSNECLRPCAALLTFQHINRENYRFSITKANNVNLCVHEQECVKSRGSVCRWVWMEQSLYVKWGRRSFILGSGCLFWTTVLSVHRHLIGYKRSFFFFSILTWWSRGHAAALHLRLHTPTFCSLLEPQNVLLLAETEEETMSENRSHRSEPSFISHLMNTDYPVAIELSGF